MSDKVRVIQLPEYKEGIDIKVKVAPQRAKLPPSLFVFQTFAKLASTRLKSTTNQMLMFFFSCAEFENFIGIDVKTLAEDLKMHKTTVISAINELVEHNVIIRIKNTRDRRRNDYFINPLAAWKGGSVNRKIAIRKIKDTDIDKSQLSLFGQTQGQLEPEGKGNSQARGQKGKKGSIGEF